MPGSMARRPRSADSWRVHSGTKPRSNLASRWQSTWSCGIRSSSETATGAVRRRGWSGPSRTVLGDAPAHRHPCGAAGLDRFVAYPPEPRAVRDREEGVWTFGPGANLGEDGLQLRLVGPAVPDKPHGN